MKIAVDVDGVLINLMVEWLRIYNNKYNDNKRLADIKKWAFYEDFGISKQECYNIFHLIKLKDVPEIEPEVYRCLNIINKKHDVDIVTARRESARKELVHKLQTMNIWQGKQYDNLVIVDYEPHTNKKDLDYNVYIDDSPELAIALSSMRSAKKCIVLYTQPWNHHINQYGNNCIARADDWKEVLKWLKQFPCEWAE